MVVLDSAEPLATYLTIEDWSSDLAKNAYSRIRIGSQAKRSDLLKIALMSSENRASYNLGVHHPGGMKAFVAAMNAKAVSLGMGSTTFVDPMGLSPENRSTASDLSKMIRAAYSYDVIRSFSTTSQHTVNFKGPRYQLGYGNTNPLISSTTWEVELTKTGYLTEAGRCLVMVTQAQDRPLAMVMLNSLGKRSPLGDAGRMLRWIESGAESSIAPAAKDYEKQMLKQHGLSNTQGE
ncbi:MAG: D-alanyl-D-alanine endopeptidase, partial [Proteobacteria bacterium]|nr:D-alanyl-D-alanine endopeptidase [Pseudomonadota bacterium]